MVVGETAVVVGEAVVVVPGYSRRDSKIIIIMHMQCFPEAINMSPCIHTYR